MTSNSAVSDPLSEVTRRERRALLGVSALGFTMSITGLIPTKISALGIDFAPKEQGQILMVMTGIICYFLVGFIVYAWSDFTNWRSKLSLWRVHNQSPPPVDPHEVDYYDTNTREEIHDLYNEGDIEGAQHKENELIHDRIKHELESEYRKHSDAIPSASRKRSYFEFILPVIVALIAIYTLLVTVVSVSAPTKEASTTEKLFLACSKNNDNNYGLYCLDVLTGYKDSINELITVHARGYVNGVASTGRNIKYYLNYKTLDMSYYTITETYGCVRYKTEEDLAKAFIKWVNRHPEEMDKSLLFTARLAFLEYFPPPCEN